MYPLRVRITKPVEIEAFKKIKTHRVTRIKPNTAKSIGRKIPRKIKRDGFFIEHGRIGIDNPRLQLVLEPAYGQRKGIDVIFKNIF